MGPTERAAGVPGAPDPKTPGSSREGGSRPRASARLRRAKVVVPGFEIETEIGRGGMGIVYRARQTSIGREVAVKVLPSAAAKDPTFIEKFLREARAAARLNHENVVSAIDAGRAGDVVYFVMEYIDGPTIRDLIDRDGPLPLDMALRIMRDAAKALVHAQRHGLVHRDVKPDNIMLNADGRALLCDLGLARMAEESRGEKGKRTGVAEGTPYYIAPEQAKGFADIDIRADIYALGATAYHMLTGRYAYDGTDARDIMWKQVNEPFPDVTEICEGLPPALVDLVARMVEKDREKRIADPAEVVSALERIMAATGVEPAVAARPGGPPATLLVAIGGAALALLIAVGGGYAILGSGKARPAKGAVAQASEGGGAAAHGAADGAAPRAIEPAAPTETARVEPGDTAREAEAALKLTILEEDLRTQAEPTGAIRRYRELASEYAGTKAARRCEDAARALEARVEEQLARKLRDVDSIAGDLARRGEFAAAAKLYGSLLEEERGGPGEEKVTAAIRRVEEASTMALAKLEKVLDIAAKRGKAAEAAALFEAFSARAAGPSVDRAKKLALELRRETQANALVREAEAFVGASLEMIRRGSYAEAVRKIAAALEDPKYASVKDALEEARREAEWASRAAAAVAASLAALPERADLPLLAGGTVAGRIEGYDPAKAVVKIVEAPGREQKDPPATELALAEIEPAYLERLGLPAGTVEGHLGNGLFFLHRRALAAAVRELEAAERLGARLPAALAGELERARKGRGDALAEAFYRRGAALVRLGKHETALPILSRLVARGDLASSGAAATFRKEIREAWTKARAAELLAGPVQAFFNGKVEARGLKVRITYTFNDPDEIADWKPQRLVEDPFKESNVKHSGSVFEMTGRVLWRGAFKGEVALEATIASGGPNVNASFVVYDRGRPWDGWICGIGATIPGTPKIFLSPNAPQRAGALYEFPSHLVARARGSRLLTEYLFAARGPVAPASGGFRMAIQVKARRLTMLFMGRVLATVPIAESDMQGGIAIQPHSEKLLIDELRLAGEIDENWLEAEALRRAEAELAAAETAAK